MWFGRVLWLFFLFCGLSWADGDSRIVKTAQGPVRGHRHPDGDFFTFYNIPYATAPTGKDRFKAPLPGPVWLDTFDAVDRGIICPQMAVGEMQNTSMQENCLVANVFVPDTEAKNLPVVFVVHGGGYLVGNGNMMRPLGLVKSRKVIYVTFNYRLGIHGFLCLGTPEAPGNAGMKDQVAALRWVHRNIASFGGNPNDITLQGYSAGSSSVDLLLLSNTTKGLFNKAIPESGANVATWSVQIEPLANAKFYIQKFGLDANVNDFYALQEFYLTAPYEQLIKDTFFTAKDNTFVFSPCVERDTGVERFLDDHPVNILKSGKYNKVPMMYGLSNMEGYLRVQYGFYDFFKKSMNDKFSDFLPQDLQFKSEEEKEKVAKKVKEFYFGDKAIDDDTITGFINFFSDVIFAHPILRSLKLQVEAGNDKIYFYEFAFNSEHPIPDTSKVILGADHCAQSYALQNGVGPGTDPDESKLPDDLKKMKAILREIWVNFITTGKPSASVLPEWPTADGHGSPYMEISLNPVLRNEQLVSHRRRFWDAIYDKHYRAPMPPPPPPARHTEF